VATEPATAAAGAGTAPLLIRRHRAGAGLRWVQGGLRLFARQPLVLVVLVGLGPLVLSTLQIVVPLLGIFLTYLMAPAVSLGALNVCRAVQSGTTAGPANYLAALRDAPARRHLLQLGVYYALVAGIMALVVSQAGGDAPGVSGAPAAQTAPAPAPAGAAATPAPTPQAAAPAPGAASVPATDAAPLGDAVQPLPRLSPLVLLLLAVVGIPFAMSICFAPALAGWHGMPAAKALFFSFFACWRNRTALLVYLLSLLGLSVLAVSFLGALIDILNAKAGLAPYLLLAPLLFLMLAIFQSAHLVMIDAVIDDGRAPAPGAAGHAGS